MIERQTVKRVSQMLAVTMLLGACTQAGGGYGDPGINKQTGGTLVGAGLGGLVGSQFGRGGGKTAATILGVVAGGLIGNQVGASLDERDRMVAERQTQVALESAPTGRQTEWRNPDTGNYGYVTPQAAYQQPDGRYCREYTQRIYVGGKSETAVGRACRNPDGTWQPVQS